MRQRVLGGTLWLVGAHLGVLLMAGVLLVAAGV
jgi:hypothetical protein